jgi:hypothetical protein
MVRPTSTLPVYVTSTRELRLVVDSGLVLTVDEATVAWFAASSISSSRGSSIISSRGSLQSRPEASTQDGHFVAGASSSRRLGQLRFVPAVGSSSCVQVHARNGRKNCAVYQGSQPHELGGSARAPLSFVPVEAANFRQRDDEGRLVIQRTSRGSHARVGRPSVGELSDLPGAEHGLLQRSVPREPATRRLVRTGLHGPCRLPCIVCSRSESP